MLDLGLVHNPLPAMEREVGPPYAFPDAMVKLGPGEINRPLPWMELTDQQRDFQAAKMSIPRRDDRSHDREIGRVIAQLRAWGCSDDTLVFFASDNGASAEIMVRGDGHDPEAAPRSAPTHLCLGPVLVERLEHAAAPAQDLGHEGGISTPLIAHWPNGIAAHGRCATRPRIFIDIVPTVLDLAGAKAPTMWDDKPVPPAPGRSLVPNFAKDGVVNQ